MILNKKLLGLIILGFAILALVSGYFHLKSNQKSIFNFGQRPSQEISNIQVDKAIADKFEYLSKNGNSSCSASFKDSILTMTDGEKLRGSCCSPMNLERYSEQTEGLKKYANIPEIPPDPYDVEVSLAKKFITYYDEPLTVDEQKSYDYAMANSHEKGPCCCKCWRWFVYGGLGKYLIKNYHFTGEQVTDIWNLSDGCGGNS